MTIPEGPVTTRATRKASKASDEELQKSLGGALADGITVLRSTSMTQSFRNAIWKVYEINMKQTLEGSSFGWDPTVKQAEIFHENARLLVYPGHSEPEPDTLCVAAFGCFRFEGDPDCEGIIRDVLYCYELQVASGHQGRGLGGRLMSAMQRIGEKWRMQMILLTALRENTRVLDFYTRKGFEIDETSPEPEEQADYHILALRL